MVAKKVSIRIVAAALFLSLAGGAVAAQAQGPFWLDEGYEIWSVSKPGTPLAYFAYDRAAAAARAGLGRDAKIVVDFSLSLGGQGELPEALARRYKESGGRADAKWLRFGVYLLQTRGAYKEIHGSLEKRPAYIAIEVAGGAAPPKEAVQLWYPSAGVWQKTDVSPGAPGYPSARDSLQAIAYYLGARDGIRYLIIRLDAWPEGDPYIILPPGWS
jgi:hypothetical protein